MIPRTYAAWPACCMSSSSTETSRIPSVTGGVQRVSTTRFRSASLISDTSFTLCAYVVSWYSSSSGTEAVAAATEATCSELCAYPWSIIPEGSPNRPVQLPDDHTCVTPNAAATWSSCTRVRCQISQLTGLAPGAIWYASCCSVSPSSTSATVSRIRPNPSASNSALVMDASLRDGPAYGTGQAGSALTSATVSGRRRIVVIRRSANLAGCPVWSRSTQTERSPIRAAGRTLCTQLLAT